MKKRKRQEADELPFFSDTELRRFVQRPQVRLAIDGLGVIGAAASIAGLWLSVAAVTKSSWSVIAVAGITLAALLLASTLVVLYQGAALRNERFRWLREADPALVYSLLARSIGVTRDDYKRILVLKPDGGATADFSYVLRAVNQRVDVVEHKTVLDTADPAGAAGAITLPQLFVKRRRVRHECRTASGGCELIQELRFVPPLRRGEHDLVEGRGMGFPARSFALLKADLPSDRDFDYSAVEPMYPSDHLSCELRFPTGYAPSVVPDFDVWVGGGRTRHESEYERIREEGGFEYTGDSGAEASATLKVKYPIPGLRYAITWRPVVSPPN